MSARFITIPLIGAILGAGTGFLWTSYGISWSACPPKCNVILVSVDSVRADYVNEETTPALSTWSKEHATSFEEYTSAAYLTPIAEMTVHTSVPPLRSGMVRFDTVLRDDVSTLAEILKDAGYSTAALGSSPEFFRRSQSLTSSFSRGFDSYYENRTGNKSERRETVTFNEERDLPREAIEWLDESREEPFFLWLTVGSAHWPYPVEEPVLDSALLTWWTGIRNIYNGKIWSLKNPGVSTRSLIPETDEMIKDAYRENLSRTDAFLGDFFNTLKKKGYLRNSIIVIQSEHGEDMGEHGHYSHYDIYNTGVRTPLFIHAPRIQPGTSKAVVSSLDILPTILDFLNIPVPEQAEGKSLRPLLEGEVLEETPVFITRVPLWEHVIANAPRATSEHSEGTHPALYERMFSFNELDAENISFDVAIRTSEWKLIWRKSKAVQEKYGWWQNLTRSALEIPEYELYNLLEDPTEQNNVYQENPEVATSLRQQLKDWVERQESNAKEPSIKGTVQPYF